MSLRWRIAGALAVLAATATVVVAVTSYVTTAHQLSSAVDASLLARASEIGRGPGRSGPSTIDDNGCPPDPLLRPASAAQIVADSGKVAPCLSGGPLLPAPDPRPGAGTVSLETRTVGGVDYRIAATAFHAGGVLQLAESLAPNQAVLDALSRKLVGVGVLVTLLAGLAGWLLARQLVRPLVALRDRAHALADAIMRGDAVDRPPPMTAPGEVRDLGRSFTTLVDALATSRQQQRRLVVDAGHEIRTPLTSLSANLDLLDRYDELAPVDRPDVLAAVRADVDELTDVMTQLIDLAADPTRDEPVVEVDLAELAEAAAARTQRRTGRTVTVVSPDRGTVRGRPAMLERAIANLLDNAAKYSPADAPIEVHTTATSVVVIDHGPGIAEADREHVFERFWRADSARNRPGSGLGLAIVRQIVLRHDGELLVDSAPAAGSRIGFRLPGPSQ